MKHICKFCEFETDEPFAMIAHQLDAMHKIPPIECETIHIVVE